ncbi:glycogen debranching protein GlgX [Mucilaginibacter ginkgonis]|uniref:Glycogen debranching protein GlgX n=1 Tax=Mucilaginibacter ginkgonis TaxID=2682091 RepID=A0A6I4I1P6_9SPHI|nr:glycogen debranching protein GlgX [Mucilaginibacter ginkgonis]QQL50679.1 glycogen debranching protein GlgX [Mucilaginibacter ginkgonis]
MDIKTYPGDPYPLGATFKEDGVNFALFARNATGVLVCLFNSVDDKQEYARIPLTERTHQIWHGFVPGLKASQLYGFRVEGPYDPANGQRFNANKLLIDPYAKAIAGPIEWHDSLFGYEVGHPDEDLSFNDLDSAPYLPKSVVIDCNFDWEGDKHLKIPMTDTIIYEAHVRGFTKLCPDIPENERGTYKGLANPFTIKYLKDLGTTAIELMPVHHFLADGFLKAKGLTNYWGYNTIGYFAPEVLYCCNGVMGEQVNEFKQMVKDLHKAGIEVILDVVYNHTAEGNQLGPTICFRGIDNEAYYRLVDDNKRYYMDYTGTGNTLNANLSSVLRLIMDSLRYWITEMHVDGFRFDLASALARELHEVNQLSSFFEIIYQDPVISQVKLIAEPWDVGEGGYQVGKFPSGWREWNGKYRDTIRDFWRGEDGMLAEFAQRITGSPDLYQNDMRHPAASVNFITAHDGFTLNDLVTYNEKHNEANGDNNTDGGDHNRSCNYGAEGPTDDHGINTTRERQKRNFLTTMFLSQGIPMLVAGDEISRTQLGNNNAYCQDNEISWLNWNTADKNLLKFTQQLIKIRQDHPAFRRKQWFCGRDVGEGGIKDIEWFLPDGNVMSEESWQQGAAKAVAVFLNGDGLQARDVNGEQLKDDDFYLIFNAGADPVDFKLPPLAYSNQWRELINTAKELNDNEVYQPEDVINIAGRSVVLLSAN